MRPPLIFPDHVLVFFRMHFTWALSLLSESLEQVIISTVDKRTEHVKLLSICYVSATFRFTDNHYMGCEEVIVCVPYPHLYFCLDCVVQHTLLIFLSYYYTTKNEARFKVRQMKPISHKRFCTSPHFESEVFWNSQMTCSR